MFDVASRKMGARVRMEGTARLAAGVTVDIQSDARGEFFLLRHAPDVAPDLTVLNIQPKDRHLLLMSRVGNEKQKFLCGHDERHWFVAAIPESAPVSNVAQAKAALKPVEVRRQEARAGIRPKLITRRRNPAFVRQGEWFFVPAPDVKVPELLILKHEPLVRSRMGKPHFAEECFRTGGELVYVARQYPAGLSEEKYRKLLRDDAGAKALNWQTMRRNPEVLVRGRISHPDHATVILTEWHRVYMNTETQAKANAAVVFLD